MYKDKKEADSVRNASLVLEFFKICVAVILLFLGGYLVFWVIAIIEQILNNPESLSVINAFAQLESSQQIVDISINGDTFVLKGKGIAKWIVLVLLFVIIFNILGRVIASIFSGAMKIIANANFNQMNAIKYASMNNEDFSCEHCGSPYNPLDYRLGTTIRCENCKKVIMPKY